MQLLRSYQKIKDRIKQACQKSGRPPQTVQLIAVSKKQKPEKILHLAQAGHRDFGENYVQEWQEKTRWLSQQDPQLSAKIRWHFLGSLQSNKAKALANQIHYLHSLSSLKVAQKIAQKSQGPQKILLQIKLAQESNKSGLSPQEAFKILPELEKIPQLQISGLMTLPKVAGEAQTKNYFGQLKSLLDEIRPKLSKPLDFKELSMGMSQDFEWAIESGSTMIRVGTALFGPRASA